VIQNCTNLHVCNSIQNTSTNCFPEAHHLATLKSCLKWKPQAIARCNGRFLQSDNTKHILWHCHNKSNYKNPRLINSLLSDRLTKHFAYPRQWHCRSPGRPPNPTARPGNSSALGFGAHMNTTQKRMKHIQKFTLLNI